MPELDKFKNYSVQPGFSYESNKTNLARIGWCKCHHDPSDKNEEKVDYLKNIQEQKITLFGVNDEYIAIAHDNTILVFDFDKFGKLNRKSMPIAKVRSKEYITHLISSGSNNPLEIIVADKNGTIWLYDFSMKGHTPYSMIFTEQPQIKLLVQKINEVVIRILKTKKKIIIQTQISNSHTYRLYQVDHRSKQLDCIGDLNLDKSIDLLHPQNTGILIGFKKDEVCLLYYDEANFTSTLSMNPLDIPRVSAATLLNNQYLLVAQKGGNVSKVNVTKASRLAINNQTSSINRSCKILYELLRRCGCIKLCNCTDSCDHENDDDKYNPPTKEFEDDEPCEDHHIVKLPWTAKKMYVVGEHIVAFSKGNRRMAVMDQKLNLLFERFLSRTGTLVNVGQRKTQKMIIYHSKNESLETWSLKDYVTSLKPKLPDDFTFIPPSSSSNVSYYGNRNPRSSVNPKLKACLFTVIEPGQNFTDPDQNKFLAQNEPRVFDVVNDYYDENSYGNLDVQVSVFGSEIGGTRKPLVLPQPAADYFYDAFRAGGVQAIMPADWTNPIVLDGTESLELQTFPSSGSGKNYDIPFASLWTSKNLGNYPITINFDGTEVLQFTVEDQEGDNHILDLNFGTLSITHNQGDDENAFLDTLATHFTNAIRSAESSLTGSPIIIQEVVFRRIRLNDDDTEFGELQGQFKIHPAVPSAFTKKGTLSVTSLSSPLPNSLESTGFANINRIHGVLTSESITKNYLHQCLSAAQSDANEGPGLNTHHFENVVKTSEDTVSKELTVSINLSRGKGGSLAYIEMINSEGHSTSGWSSASPLTASESSWNKRNVLRYSRKLIDDVFTAAMDHIRAQGTWDRENIRNLFEDFDAMIIGFVGEPPTSIPVSDRWGCDDPADFEHKRMFKRTHFAQDQNDPDPNSTPVSMSTDVVFGQVFSDFTPGVMAHELGHAIGLPDLYSASGYRDDVKYVGNWAMMGGGNEKFNHYCGWSKWAVGWITEDEDDELNRVVDVPLPAPTGTSITESWLVPIEYWDDNIKTDVRNAVGNSLPISQLMKIHLGSDGGVINFLELRSQGSSYSKSLPPNPSVIATNVLDPQSDRRWAVNGLYRRKVHLLNEGDELMNIGDTWDFAKGVEFPLKGCIVKVMDIQSIRGGSIPIFHLRVEREKADFVDLHFQDNAPSWRSPDIWVDWVADNSPPNSPRIYPEGTPTDQGETIRFPSTGVEKHYVVARVHNGGTTKAEDVKVRWFTCDPPGSGDDGRWVEKDTKIIPEVGPGTWEIVAFDWNVDSSTNSHQCLRAEIIDWTIPSTVDPSTGDTIHLASDDVKLQNNNAQQNVFDFEALAGSPYQKIEFQFQVHNDNVDSEIATLVPEGLPWGSKLEISPAEAEIKPNQTQIFNCKLSLDDSIIRPGCNSDVGFLLNSWRRAEDSDEKWGSCFYFVRPRYKTKLEILKGYWAHSRLTLHGKFKLDTTEDIDISQELPLYVRVRLEFDGISDNNKVEWLTLPLDNDGQFNLDIQGGIASRKNSLSFTSQAWFDRTNLLGSSVSNIMQFKRQIVK